jgi:hypothetical protein
MSMFERGVNKLSKIIEGEWIKSLRRCVEFEVVTVKSTVLGCNAV